MTEQDLSYGSRMYSGKKSEMEKIYQSILIHIENVVVFYSFFNNKKLGKQ